MMYIMDEHGNCREFYAWEAANLKPSQNLPVWEKPVEKKPETFADKAKAAAMLAGGLVATVGGTLLWSVRHR